ncbi:MAG: hypothetical protein DKINENOH_05419 [bacterium]|nr:hypothetical protein [bacterium]
MPFFFKKLFLSACLPFTLFAQPSFITSLYPPQHGLNIPAGAELRVSLQAPLDPASLSDSAIYVWSDITGLHRLTVTLENGNRDLRIVPRHWRLNDRPAFNAGERVTVTLTTRLRYADGRSFEGFTWHYTVAVRQGHGGVFKVEALFGGGASTYFYVSDFNGDGWCDLVGNDDGVQRKMIVFLNDQKGGIVFHHMTNITGSTGEVTDFDKDGDQDIFFGFQRVILNDGAGNLIQRDYFDWPNGQGKAHDFNGDGKIDYVIGYVLSDTLYFGLSVNGEAFKKLQKMIAPIRHPTFYRHGISYDLNNDGMIDFLYVGGWGGGAELVGFASFQTTRTDSLQLVQVKNLFYEQGSFYGNDFDGDGDIDYCIVAGGTDNYVTFFNDGDGQLIPSGLQRDPNDTRIAEAVTGGDFDGDGDIDLAFANSNFVSAMPETYEPDVLIFSNDGTGNFSLTNRFRLPFDRPINGVLHAVDFDGDGDLDLIGIANGLFYLIANGEYPNAVADQSEISLPNHFSIEPVFPNPARGQAEIMLNLPEHIPEKILVTIFDSTGRQIKSWELNGGQQRMLLLWDAHDQNARPVPSGAYFVRAQLGKLKAEQKLLLLK